MEFARLKYGTAQRQDNVGRKAKSKKEII